MSAKKIIITGGSGFIGSNTAELLSKNHQVTVVDIKKPEKAISNVKYIQTDCRNISDYESELKTADTVFHFAATVSVPLCQQNPTQTYENNFLSTVRIAEYCSLLDRKPMIVFASSASNYGNNGKIGIPLKETDTALSPLSFYGAQKMNSEEALRVFYSTRKLPSICFRFFNVFGVGQDDSSPYTGVISIFRKILKSEQKTNHGISINGDGKQTRDFVSVKDVARACEKTLSINDYDGSAINIGSGKTTSILELASIMIEIANKDNQGLTIPITHRETRQADVRYSMADISKAKTVLNWQPTIELRKGLEELIQFT